MAVHLTKIYTRTGDEGETRLADMSVTTKSDPRVASYGDVNEANAAIGLVLAVGQPSERIAAPLRRVQNELFDVGADLATPVVPDPETEPLRVTPAYVDRLEADCDALAEGLPTLNSFVLPGGTPAAAYLHLACTTVRRAERTAWRARAEHGSTMNPLAITYLNRLSDLLFIAARAANHDAVDGDGDVLWKPGGER